MSSGMVRKKLHPGIRHLAERAQSDGHRCVYLVLHSSDDVKDSAESSSTAEKKQSATTVLCKSLVPFLYELRMKLSGKRPSVLWAFKDALGFSTSAKKRHREQKEMDKATEKHRKKESGKMEKRQKASADGHSDDAETDVSESLQHELAMQTIDSEFDVFLSSVSGRSASETRFVYFKETEQVLGKTYDMLVVQDLEQISANSMCHVMETVSAGGIALLLMKVPAESIQQAQKGQAALQIQTTNLFHQRLVNSLVNCGNCIVLNDSLDVIGVPSSVPQNQSLSQSVFSSQDKVYALCKTADQASMMVNLAADKSLAENQPVNAKVGVTWVTGDRGRGKSACLGMHIGSILGQGAKNEGLGSSSLGSSSLSTPGSSVWLTAPTLSGAQVIFSFAIQQLVREHGLQPGIDFEVTSRDRSGNVVMSASDTTAASLESLTSSTGGNAVPTQTVSITVKSTKSSVEFVDLQNLLSMCGPGSSSAGVSLSGASGVSCVFIDEASSISANNMDLLLSGLVPGNYRGSGRIQGHSGQHSSSGQNSSSDGFGPSQRDKHGILGPSLKRVVVSSTAHGYEGSGRSLGLVTMRKLFVSQTLNLSTPIRYSPNCPVERWLYKFALLGEVDGSSTTSGASSKSSGGSSQGGQLAQLEPVESLTLFRLNKRSLVDFSDPSSEARLEEAWDVLRESHYRNSPNDLMTLCTSDSHELFVLASKQQMGSDNSRSENHSLVGSIYGVLQIAYEGNPKVDLQSVQSKDDASRPAAHPSISLLGESSIVARADGLVPSVVSEQFPDFDIAKLVGARIVRIATRRSLQGKGYGKRLVDLFSSYLESSRPRVAYFCASFGVTGKLFSFWSDKCKLVPLYVRQTPSEVTGEHSMVMLKWCSNSHHNRSGQDQMAWLKGLVTDFLSRFSMNVSSGHLRRLPVETVTAIAVACRTFATEQVVVSDGIDELMKESQGSKSKTVEAHSDSAAPSTSSVLLSVGISMYDQSRLERYAIQGHGELALVSDLIPLLTRAYFLRVIPGLTLSSLQEAILVGIGFQRLTLHDLSSTVFPGIGHAHLMAMLEKALRKFATKIAEQLKSEYQAKLESSERSSLDKAPAPSSRTPELVSGKPSVNKKEAEAMAATRKEFLAGKLGKYAVKHNEGQVVSAAVKGL